MEESAYVNFLAPYISALQTEITTIKESSGSRKRLIDGRLLDINNNRYVYSFEADDELHLPDDSPVMIIVGKQSAKGVIIACEGFTVIASLADDLGKFLDSAELVSESWMIMERLCDHLREDRIQEASLPRALEQGKICRMSPFIGGQDEAIKRSISQPITIIWGPPGTGKTYTLARIAIEHIRLGHRILMVSHSNVSVDEAIYKTESLSNHEPGVLLRYGYPRNEKVTSSSLSSMNLALSTKPELFSKRKNLLTEKRKLKECGVKDARYVDVGKKLKDIRTQIREEERRLVLSAKMVATTISKAVMDSAIYDNEYDVVFLMKQVWHMYRKFFFAASLARISFCCFGDYKQLPPIVQSDHPQTKLLLSKDIFSVVGVSDAVARNSGHDWLVMLNLQRRMHSHIAKFVSVHMHNGLLQTPPDLDTNLIEIIDTMPTITSSMSMIDLTGMMSVCSKTLDHSRFNLLGAFISVKVALASRQTPNPHVGSVAGYDSGQSSAYGTLTCAFTAPSVPSTVTIGGGSSAYAAAGANVTMAWSGAGAGTNNPITGYHIYRDGVYYAATTGTSYSVPVHGTAGNSYTYTIYTLGTYANSGASVGRTVYTYGAPSPPTSISISDATPDAGSNVTLPGPEPELVVTTISRDIMCTELILPEGPTACLKLSALLAPAAA